MPTTQELIRDLADRVGPAVIGIGRGGRGGCGVVVDPGHVVTLRRNVRGEEVTVTFSDDREARATVLGVDPDLDLAVLSVDTGAVTPVPWASDEPIAIGTELFALANPGGRGLRVTAGHASAEGLSVRGRRGRLVSGVIEHTAPLPRGSGGGPLLDAEGRLVGLNAVRVDGGLILALPATAARPRVEALLAGRPARPRKLGVAIVPPRAARRLRRAVGLPDREGLLVRGVEAGGPADAAGLQRGDLIVAAGGPELTDVDDLYAVLDRDGTDDLALRIVRGTDEHELQITGETGGRTS